MEYRQGGLSRLLLLDVLTSAKLLTKCQPPQNLYVYKWVSEHHDGARRNLWLSRLEIAPSIILNQVRFAESQSIYYSCLILTLCTDLRLPSEYERRTVTAYPPSLVTEKRPPQRCPNQMASQNKANATDS